MAEERRQRRAPEPETRRQPPNGGIRQLPVPESAQEWGGRGRGNRPRVPARPQSCPEARARIIRDPIHPA